jgi:endo-1,4-beta-xylanase
MAFVLPGVSTPPAGAAATVGLRRIALQKRVFVGTMLSGVWYDRLSDPDVVTTVCGEFNMLSAGNAFKWQVIQPREGEFNWVPAERLAAVATACGMRFVGSPLVWKWQLPSWVKAYDGHPAKLREVLRTHITKVVRHFAGRVHVWDVVNEIVDFNGFLYQDIWMKNLGPGYVADAFRWARAADPLAKLYYNDFTSDGLGRKGNGVYRHVRRWLGQGAPIDGVGIQAHGVLESRSQPEIVANMRRLARIGLETRLSEIAIPVGPGSVGTLNEQAQVFYDLTSACFAPGTGCKMFTVWGVSDRYFRPVAAWKHACCGTLLDDTFKRKPAYFAVKAALENA